jgi:hypothetical protein
MGEKNDFGARFGRVRGVIAGGDATTRSCHCRLVVLYAILKSTAVPRVDVWQGVGVAQGVAPAISGPALCRP